MAGFGLVLLLYRLAQKRESSIDKDFFYLSVWAALVSLIGFFSIVYNNTLDSTYATYIISMWVWMAAAYVVVQSIKALHRHLSVELLCNYLIAVCVIQCLIAFAMTQYAPLKDWVDSFLEGTGFMGKAGNRMYGIGASFDVAGGRFAVVLSIIVCLLIKIAGTNNRKYTVVYMLAFVIISVIGNMISRTTLVGLIVALCYLIYESRIYTFRLTSDMKFVYGWFVIVLMSAVFIMFLGYHINSSFRENFRFGFEGFFSLVEKGKWEVHSNEILKEMYVFPDNMKTWIIGDGYFEGPNGVDPYYIGENWTIGFYKGTDVGYLRFIFYFGLIGLGAFCTFMYKVGTTCMLRFSSYKSLFFIILLLNFIIWFKVSTDIFLVFALFLCINTKDIKKVSSGI